MVPLWSCDTDCVQGLSAGLIRTALFSPVALFAVVCNADIYLDLALIINEIKVEKKALFVLFL